jgi:hypothetical protein
VGRPSGPQAGHCGGDTGVGGADRAGRNGIRPGESAGLALPAGFFRAGSDRGGHRLHQRGIPAPVGRFDHGHLCHGNGCGRVFRTVSHGVGRPDLGVACDVFTAGGGHPDRRAGHMAVSATFHPPGPTDSISSVPPDLESAPAQSAAPGYLSGGIQCPLLPDGHLHVCQFSPGRPTLQSGTDRAGLDFRRLSHRSGGHPSGREASGSVWPASDSDRSGGDGSSGNFVDLDSPRPVRDCRSGPRFVGHVCLSVCRIQLCGEGRRGGPVLGRRVVCFALLPRRVCRIHSAGGVLARDRVVGLCGADRLYPGNYGPGRPETLEGPELHRNRIVRLRCG